MNFYCHHCGTVKPNATGICESCHKFPINPRFIHDCDACYFLGKDLEYDYYFCLQDGLEPTTICRYGNEGHEYSSGLILALFPECNHHFTACKLAYKIPEFKIIIDKYFTNERCNFKAGKNREEFFRILRS